MHGQKLGNNNKPFIYKSAKFTVSRMAEMGFKRDLNVDGVGVLWMNLVARDVLLIKNNLNKTVESFEGSESDALRIR